MTRAVAMRVALLFVCAVGVLAAGLYGEAPAADAPGQTRTPAPATAGERPHPAADPDAGRQAYAAYCATCHGPKGDGNGPMSAMLNPRPARHSDGAHMRTLSDEYLFTIIKEGGPAVGKSPMMTAWSSTLSDDQIRDLVAYIRTLAK